MQKVSIPTLNGQNVTLAAVIHQPANFDASQKYPVIVVAHPGGGVKEQASGLYAKKLAEQGLLAIAFDASFQVDSNASRRCSRRLL